MFGKQKEKSEQKSNYTTASFYKKHRTLITASMVIIVVGGLIFSYQFIVGSSGQKKEKAQGATCGEMTVANDSLKGAVPFTPLITAKVGGSFDQNGEICQLLFDGNRQGKYKPVNGECKFDNLKITSAGSYKVGYSAKGSDGKACTKEITLKVGPEKTNATKDTEGKEGGR